jgi:transcriptional regulator with XRE-family HTH domain
MTESNAGEHLRAWRQRRRLSQLDLACNVGVSSRHISFIETGRSTPSRDMIERLSDELEVPLRRRNEILIAAGFAPRFPERTLNDPLLASARQAIERVLQSHLPMPAFALDRGWDVIASNGALPEIYEGVAPELLTHPINVIRLSLHPQGLAPRLQNHRQWRDHLIHRLRHDVEMTADQGLMALLEEATNYPYPTAVQPHGSISTHPQITTQLSIDTSLGILTFITTTTVFGTPSDVTLSEMMLELFFPADEQTRSAILRRGN